MGKSHGAGTANAAAADTQHFWLVFRDAPMGIALVDMQGHPMITNSALERMLGYSAEELRGMTFAEVTHPDDVKRDLALFQELVEGRRSHYQLEKQYITRDGKTVRGHLTVSLVRDEADKPAYAIGMVEDITERWSLQHQLWQSQRLEAVGELAAGIAHDFNNLLTAICGYAQFVQDAVAADHGLARDVDEILKAGERAANLTRQLLAYSRRQALQPALVDLNGIIRDLESMLRRLIRTGVSLNLKLDPSLHAVVADPGQIEQVVTNLVVNARDAMPDGGQLTIETADVDIDDQYASHRVGVSTGSYAMLAVSDDGIGMSQEIQAKVFEPFFTTKERGKGTGLGLSTVYGIVKQSRGNVWVYSEPGHGATFKVYLPHAEEQGMAIGRVAPSIEAPDGQELVLVVDDDPLVASFACRALEIYGYSTLHASDPMEARQRFEQHQREIAVLVTDIILPTRINGPDLVAEFLSRRPHLRYLYMSGYADGAIIQGGMLAPGVPFLTKPFTARQLATAIRGVLDA